jgi:putative FmdB family regulatory protein
MTLYDLHCRECDHYFDEFQDRNARGPFRCPKCGKKRAYRTILSPPAFHDRYSPMHPRAGRRKGIGRKS